MVRLTIAPRSEENLYGLLVQKELALRKKNQGTLHRYGSKKRNEEKWGHAAKHGWIRFQGCLGKVVVATISGSRPRRRVATVEFLYRVPRSAFSFVNRQHPNQLRPAAGLNADIFIAERRTRWLI